MKREQRMRAEVKEHLLTVLIPFWKRLRDEEWGGFYGYMDYDGILDPGAVKGCILNSRITWFFSEAYLLLGDGELRSLARHGYEFLRDHCLDQKEGGIFWSLSYDGTPEDTTKHTYNQAFAVYALSAYYEASGDEEALLLAKELFSLIEGRCRDDAGYLEAFTREFAPESNEKLSENGVLAERTMNTLLHVLEAYTQLYRVSGMPEVKDTLLWILDIFYEKVYNPALHRQEVFFDADYHSILDLHSYGHDIETAWLVDRCLSVLMEPAYTARFAPVTEDLTAEVQKKAFDGHSLANECDRGTVDESRVWWVQAEAVVGFLNGWQKDDTHTDYLAAACDLWDFIRDHVADPREGMEWYWMVRADGSPVEGRPVVEPWKCPYHNGRMCMEVIRRLSAEDDTAG